MFNIKKAASLLSGSFWFIPSLMIVTSVVSAYLLPSFHSTSASEFLADNNLGVSGADSAMQIVQVIATTAITITSIAFSMTIVALVMASSQFGPRLLKSFMQSKSTQFVLGVFTSTFVFCLLVLSQIDAHGDVSAYPDLSVFISIVLAILCVFVLIFFIHHVATSIRADTVVKQVACNLLRDMQALQNNSEARASFNLLEKTKNYASELIFESKCSGYLQAIEYQSIVNLANEHDGIVEMQVRAGSFLMEGTPVAKMFSDQLLPNHAEIDEAFVIGEERTALQDPLFAINQLVEMAVRALSPSLNDPFTVGNCIDRLAEALGSFSDGSLPQNALLNEEGTVRVLTKDITYPDLFAGAFTQIRQGCYSHAFVLLHLLDTFILLLKSNPSASHLVDAIKIQVVDIHETMKEKETFISPSDKKAFEQRMSTLDEYLNFTDCVYQ